MLRVRIEKVDNIQEKVNNVSRNMETLRNIKIKMLKKLKTIRKMMNTFDMIIYY